MATKSKPKTPVKPEVLDSTLQYKEPRNDFGCKGRFPYEAAARMLEDKPGEWLSLRQGPTSRMDQFRHRFQQTLELPDGWALEMRSEKLEGQDDLPYKQSIIEVYARIVETT